MAMGIHRRRDAADAIEGEDEPLAAADLGDGRVQAPGAFLPTEFAQHVVLARHAAGGDVGVEQEGPPD